MKNSSRTIFAVLIAFFAVSNSLHAANPAKDSAEFVPQWAKNVVWYQIFPERFRNGDTTNDPNVQDILGADPQQPPAHWQRHPWGSDWYKLQPYERANGEPEFWKHILRRRYGGDLQGVLDKLDYLQDLGITAIYLNPVFDAPSLHKYDGASYHHIDPNFGPDPAGDRALMATENPGNPETWVWTKADELALKLIDEAHKRGMRIIFDGVFNHMGIRSWAFLDVVKNQQNSPYKDWFIIKSWDDNGLGTRFEYHGWWGNASLPEFLDDGSGMAPGPRAYIYAATARWMNPKGKGTRFGIDGWRLDVAYCVEHSFWKDWRTVVKSINPEAYVTAEIVDVPKKVVPYMQGDEFDGEMNYNFVFTCFEFMFYPDSMRISASSFDQKLQELRELYPPGVAYTNMNLVGSHDANRIGSAIVNRGICSYRDWGSYFNVSMAAKNPNYKVSKPTAADVHLQKYLTLFQMTYVGAPMIYYGDEVGMWGANDPDCRKPMLWPDVVFEDEEYLPNQTKHPADEVAIDTDLYIFYKKIIAIRNAHPALQHGSFTTVLVDDDTDVFIFKRETAEETIFVILNNAETEQEIAMPKALKGEFADLLMLKKPISGSINVAGKWGAILLQSKK